MQVSVSSTGSLGRRVEVAVPATEVTSAVEQRLKQISRTARLKGFRPGKAPLTIVRKQFGEQVHAEVVGELMRSSFARALDQEKLRPAADPRIEPLAMAPGADLRYAAIFEVLPEIQVKPAAQLTVERPVSAVEESDVDAMIESMRRQRPVFTPVEREAREGDRVTIDFEGRIDGQPFEGGTGKDFKLLLGAGQTLPELDAAIRGARAGEQRSSSATFPVDHARAELRGKAAEFALTLKQVEEHSLPAVDEEFCRAYGVEEGGVEALRAEVRRSMERELAGLIRSRLRAQVLDGLYRENAIELPRSLLEEHITRLQVEAARRMGVRDANQLPPRQNFEDPARRRATLALVMGQIVQNEGIRVPRERVMERLEDLAGNYPNPDEARRAYLQSADAMRGIEAAVLEDEVIDWVLARAQVAERAMSFKQLTGFGQEGRAEDTPLPEAPLTADATGEGAAP